MVNCSILGCKSRSEQQNPEISFHSFPLDPRLLNQWISSTGRQNWQPTKNSKVCSLHFGNDLIVFKNKKKWLLPHSVPTKYIHGLVEESSSQRKRPLQDLGEVLPKRARMAPLAESPSQSKIAMKAVENILRIEAHKAPLAKSPSGSSKTPFEDMENVLPTEECSASTVKVLPKEKWMSFRLQKEKELSAQRLKKLRAVRESKLRLKKKVTTLENVLAELKAKMRINSEDLDLLSTIETGKADFFKRFLVKENCPRKYSGPLRKFALHLHFISPKAYNFVRNEFNTCLPHPKTLYRWYKCINCEPGFTSESFEAIKILVKKCTNKVLCAVSLDEMAIRQHLQWNGQQTVGYVNIGDEIDSDNRPIAREALVFMVTAINGNWKIPVGYFLTNGVNGEQRSALLQNCVHLLVECGVKVVSVTFDGCPANLAMAKILGATLDDPNRIDPEIEIARQKIVVFPDPCHMLKLVRNTLADKMEILNDKNEVISWEFIKKLNNLQEAEGIHLANKLRKAHIDHKKQIMKVRLAAQTFSKSVAESILFCKDKLTIEDFKESGATVEFIMCINNLFDIMNSRQLFAYGFKKPISKDFFLQTETFFHKCETYFKGLKLGSQLVLKSGRKTGFLGLMICMQALRIIYNNFIKEDNAPLKYLLTYKMSQDHLELFFSAIRSKGGFNNNPTAIQFLSAYRRLLIHGELKNIATGNCIPLDDVNILNCNKNALSRKINSTKSRLLSIDDHSDDDNEEFEPTDVPETHDYIGNCTLSEYSKEATIYIAGFIITKMSKIIKCDICLLALISCEKFESLISFTDIGGLHYPSQDVVEICLFCEKTLRNVQTIHGPAYFSKKDSLPKMISVVFKKFFNKRNIFYDLQSHINDQSPMDNHLALIIKSIALRYFETRIHHIMRSLSHREDRVRNLHTKLVLFKGQ